MKHRKLLWESSVLMLCVLAGYILQGGQVSHQPRKANAGAVPAGKPAVSYAKLPLSFEANQGQTDARVKFLSRGPGYTLFLTGDGVVLSLSSRKSGVRSRLSKTTDDGQGTTDVVRMKLDGANARAKFAPLNELPGKSNYFIGNDPHKWRTNVPTYSKVKYEGVYPGVDLVFYGNQRQLEHDFVVAPGADTSRIRLRLQGSKKVSLDAEGSLVIAVDGGEVRLEKPLIYQDGSGGRREITGGYVLKGAREVGFKVGAYDPTRPLVIDPVLAYSTYLGICGNYGNGIAVDSSGNAYVTGTTVSSNFPTTAGALQTSPPGILNVFVTKLDPSGSALVYSTYLGGNYIDFALGIAVDPLGNAYVTGWSYSADFPTTAGAFQTSLAGQGNAFVSKLNPSGSELVYSTYLGGNTDDVGRGISLDSSGHAYVTGYTYSSNFPTTEGAFQTSLAGATNSFVTKLNPSGSELVYSTYLGGNTNDVGQGISLDSSGHAYVTGYTSSTNFPTTEGAFQTSLAGATNSFVTKLNPSGSELVYSTYLGGNTNDVGQGISLDSSGHAYVTGYTSSTNFPTTEGAFQTSLAGATNSFVTKLNPSGSALAYSSYLGGNNQDYVAGISVDPSGNAWVTGETQSSNFPTTKGAFQITLASAAINAFVTKLNSSGSTLVYSTYLGGSLDDQGHAIAVDFLGNAFVAGVAYSTNFPTTPGAFQTTFVGTFASDAIVAKLEIAPREQIVNLRDTVKNLISTGALNDGSGQFLLAPLKQALDALDVGHITAATHDLEAFIGKVRHLVVFRALRAAEGQALIDAANSLITALGG